MQSYEWSHCNHMPVAVIAIHMDCGVNCNHMTVELFAIHMTVEYCNHMTVELLQFI